MAEAALPDVDDEAMAAVREGLTQAEYRGREYRYLGSPVRGVERGTVAMDGTFVRGYPSTPRVLVLDPGVQRFFDGPLAVEEKLNGYNVRIAHVGEPLAFTRGGHVCPYTTQVARDQLPLEAFFADYPETMLCAEFVGPENPYTAHDVYDVDSLAPRVFDLRHRETGRPWPVEQRRSTLDEFDVPQPSFAGVFEPEEAVPAVRERIHELDAQGREGVVMQSTDGRDLLKYTTAATHRSDLRMAFSLPFDYGQDFLFSRLLREAFQAVEFEERGQALEARAHGLGEAILEPMVETIRAVEEGQSIGEDHTVRGSPEAITELLAHFESQGLSIEIRSDRREGDQRVVALRKVANQSRDKIDHFLAGGTIDQ